MSSRLYILFAALHMCVYIQHMYIAIISTCVPIVLFVIDCKLMCQNGGTLRGNCSSCECPPDFTGMECETKIDGTYVRSIILTCIFIQMLT